MIVVANMEYGGNDELDVGERQKWSKIMEDTWLLVTKKKELGT